jgi:hypothetical protein
LLTRIPLSESVTKGEDALLGAGLVFIATGTAEGGVEAVLGEGVQQGDRLQTVP